MSTRTGLTRLARSILHAQCGAATLQQLEAAGVTRSFIANQVNARRWTRDGHHCVLAHNHTPTREQRMWLAVLSPATLAALAAWSALQTAGFTFFGRELDYLHIVVPRGGRCPDVVGVVVHESRRFGVQDIDPDSPIPRLRLPRSSLDAAAWQPSVQYACALLAAVVQQRICAVEELADQMQYVGRIRHKAHMRLALHDIAGGAEALSEIDVAALCRRFGLRPPDRQRIRRDRNGRRRYLDCEWVLSDGSIVVLEVDGSHHLKVEHWESDMKRERGVVISGRRVLRATAGEARHDQAELAADLEAIGVPRG